MKITKIKSGILIALIVFAVLAGSHMNASAEEEGCDVYCSNCDDCEVKLSWTNVTTVCLNSNINNQSGTCIDKPTNFINKIFDCQGYTIDGNHSGEDAGILLNRNSGNTVKNCVITNFRRGIHLLNSLDNTLMNNTVTLTGNDTLNYTGGGICLGSSSNNNTLINNNVSSNLWYGFYLVDSSNNNITNNFAGLNMHEGFYLGSISNSTLTNNIVYFNDDNGIYLQRSLNNTLTNNTVTLSGWDGICLSYFSNYNTIKNNIVTLTDERGIRLDSSSNNSLINNTVNSNGDDGIRLKDSFFNILMNNNITNNNGTGVSFHSSANNNNLTSNLICGNNPDVNDDDGNFGDDNTYDTGNWNDNNKTGCTTPDTLTYSISLNPGWNLISIPIHPDNTSIESVLASIDGSYTSVQAWTNGYPTSYYPEFGGTLTDIDEKMGVGIYMSQPDTLVVEGSEPANRSIHLQADWNLVGYLSTNQILQIEDALLSISGNYTFVQAWTNGAPKSYYSGVGGTLLNMSRGYGYWIYINTTQGEALEYS